MPKRKMKEEWEECTCDVECIKRKKLKMGALLVLLGLILYAKEVGMIPFAGSIWTLAMILAGIAIVIKGLML